MNRASVIEKVPDTFSFLFPSGMSAKYQVMKRTMMRISLLIGPIVLLCGSTLRVAEGQNGEDVAKYILEEMCEQYARDGDQWIAFFTRRDVAIIEATQIDEWTRDCNFTIAAQMQVRGQPVVKGTNTATKQARMSFQRGDEFAGVMKPGVVMFGFEMPTTGLEYFYLPMYREVFGGGDSGSGAVTLSTSEALSPQFVGNMTYEWRRLPSSDVQIIGERELRSKDENIRNVGSYEIRISEDSLQLKRIRHRGFFIASNREKVTAILSPFVHVEAFERQSSKSYSEVLAKYAFVLVPLGSEEANKIDVPDILIKQHLFCKYSA